jgi:hypothetical protein
MTRRLIIAAWLAILFLVAACDKKETVATDDLTADDTVDTDTAADPTLPEGDEGESDQNGTSDTSDISDNMVDEDSALSDDILSDDPTDQPDQSDNIIPDDACVDCLLPAETTCQPSAAPCDAAPVDTNIYASYRKDFYYQNYQEGDVINPIPAPVNGGRFQITGIAGKGGKVTAVKLNGTNVADLLTQTKLDWYHVYPLTLTEGEAFWVNFHSREASWDSASSGQLTVETELGTAFNGQFTYAVNQVPLKYVAFADDY